MPIGPNPAASDPGPIWAVLLSASELRLLQLCTAWHLTIHQDQSVRARFERLQERIDDARPIVDLASNAAIETTAEKESEQA
jgi:hypothetical protein